MTPMHRFSQADIHDIAPQLLDTLLNKVLSAGTPEKVAENDHLMKCGWPPTNIILLDTHQL
jgi:hypothetical protein